MIKPGRETLLALGLMAALLWLLGAIWLPYIPNELGHASADYAYWLPNLLAGYFWYLHNGLFALPWFSPADCAGVPFQADPQLGYLSLPQWLTFVTDPLTAVRISLFIYAAAGYWGAWLLARRTFAASLPAALLAAALFLLNGFYAARMAVGHLTFAPFVLLPAFCALLLRPPPLSQLQVPPSTRPAFVLRAMLAGLILAFLIQSGMLVLLPQFVWAAAAIVALHAALFGWQRGLLRVAACGLGLALALCAGKLVASGSLLSHFPRENYPLPGLPGLFGTLYVALRSLFWPFSTNLESWVRNSRIIQDPHEFAYGVGLAPPMLMIATLVLAWRQGGPAALMPRRRFSALMLAVLLMVPIAVNIYAPGWTDLLKSLPILSSSSTLLRWFIVLMLPAILGAALALDRLASARENRAWALAGASLALTVIGVAGADRTAFGSAGLGMYDPTAITQAWQRAHDTGSGPPIKAVVELFNADHHPLTIPDRQNAVAQGYSVLSCYDPLFGYRLENLPFGKIHLGLAMSTRDGVLNFKNPACYVFPGANQCQPGDQFTPDQAAALQRFLNYQSYDFHKPFLAHLADWISFLALLGVPVLVAYGIWRGRVVR